MKWKNIENKRLIHETIRNLINHMIEDVVSEFNIIVNKNKFELLKNLDLAEYFITSKAEKILSENDETIIEVSKAVGKKCQRST